MGLYLHGGYIGHSQRLSEPIAFVGGVSAGFASTTGQSQSLTALVGGLDAAPKKGDLVFVCWCSGGTTSYTLTVSGDNTGNYQVLGSGATTYSSDTYDVSMTVAYQIMGDTPDTSLTLSGGAAGQGGTVGIHVWRYVDEVNPIDVTSVFAKNTNSGLVNPGAITPVTPGCVVLAMGGAGHNVGAATGPFFASPEDAILTFFTQVGVGTTNDCTVGIGAYREWTSGSYDPGQFRLTVADSGSYSWTAATVVLRPEHPITGSTGVWSTQAKYNDSIRNL